ncbi:TetR/AcrR family transcriptional regulator [Nocardia sp. NBC_01503]|uniref:TetR/AcrR family transcriptional regulator n=1 Tax=Nocardia sp. NBC_01503 TaxID=2975997 RepID=UPI002E7C1D8D|nr:TetR/AcrR family transcriptional regulator [Nocardia sp. NBC_01503]WTL29744.1 TetR/AcrR family transcriptional regulator [Nocardia sp. NBC_01503]
MTIAGNSVASTRDRIVVAAYGLITRRGVRGLSLGDIATAAGTTESELRQHFPTIDPLVLAVLERRERVWTFGLIEEQSRCRGTTPEEQLLAIFDVFEEWFTAPDFDACTFINVLLEMGAEHPLGRAGIEHLQRIRNIVRVRAERAGLSDAEDFARSLHILMKGSVIAAAEGDSNAARRAKRMAEALIEAHRERPDDNR